MNSKQLLAILLEVLAEELGISVKDLVVFLVREGISITVRVVGNLINDVAWQVQAKKKIKLVQDPFKELKLEPRKLPKR